MRRIDYQTSIRIIMSYSFQSPLILGQTCIDFHSLISRDRNKQIIFWDFQRDKNGKVKKTHLSQSSETEQA